MTTTKTISRYVLQILHLQSLRTVSYFLSRSPFTTLKVGNKVCGGAESSKQSACGISKHTNGDESALVQIMSNSLNKAPSPTVLTRYRMLRYPGDPDSVTKTHLREQPANSVRDLLPVLLTLMVVFIFVSTSVFRR